MPKKGKKGISADTEDASAMVEAPSTAVDDSGDSVALAVGSKVLLKGLSNAAHMNNRYAMVETLTTNKDAGRCRVALLLNHSDDRDASMAPVAIKHENLEVVCTFCAALNPPHCCSRCRGAAYCNGECQLSGWPVHKKACKEIQSMVKAQTLAATQEKAAASATTAAAKEGREDRSGSAPSNEGQDAMLRCGACEEGEIDDSTAAEALKQWFIVSILADSSKENEKYGDSDEENAGDGGQDQDFQQLLSMGFERAQAWKSLKTARQLGATGTSLALEYLMEGDGSGGGSGAVSSATAVAYMSRPQQILARAFRRMGSEARRSFCMIQNISYGPADNGSAFAEWILTPEARDLVTNSAAKVVKMRADSTYAQEERARHSRIMEKFGHQHDQKQQQRPEMGFDSPEEGTGGGRDFSANFSLMDVGALEAMGYSRAKVVQGLNMVANVILIQQVQQLQQQGMEVFEADVIAKVVEFMSSDDRNIRRAAQTMATEFLSQDKIQDDQERGRSVEAVVHGNRGVKAAAEGAASATSGQIGAGSPPSAISGIARGGSSGGASGGGTAAKAKNAKPKVNGGGGKAKKKALLGTGDFSALVMVLNDWTEMQRLDFMDCHQMTQFQFGMMMTVLSRPGCDGPQVAALLEDLHIEGANLSIAHLAAILVERTKDFTAASSGGGEVGRAAEEPSIGTSPAAGTESKVKTNKKGKKEKAQLMPQEKLIIRRLAELGVSYPSAIKAFREAGGHEQRAANILIEWMAEGKDLGTPAPPVTNKGGSGSGGGRGGRMASEGKEDEDPDVISVAHDGSYDLDA